MLKSNVAASVLALTLALSGTAHSQVSAPGGKKELVAKVIQLTTPGIEGAAQQIALQPAMQMQQSAAAALQQLPAERREAVARDIEADLRKYAEDVVPLARSRAIKLAPSTIGAILEDRLTEDELRQVVGILESPTWRKFQGVTGDMQRALSEKLVAELRADIEPKVRTLGETIGRRLNPTPTAPAAAPAAPKK